MHAVPTDPCPADIGSPSPVDWGALEAEGVEQIVTRAARKTAFKFDGLDFDDLLQEARLRVAMRPELLACIGSSAAPGLTLGTLQHRLELDLLDIARREVTISDRHTSYEQRAETDPATGRTPRRAAIAVRNDTAAYTLELVESLIPAVWDDSYAWGIRVENAPDVDMPRGTTNKATGGTLAAHVADIKTAWLKAPLTLPERQALYLSSLGWSWVAASGFVDVTGQGLGKRFKRGVHKLTAWLNGDEPTSSADRVSFRLIRSDMKSEAVEAA